MESINKESLVQKLTNIANGFRTSRSLTDQLTLDEMAELAAVPITSGENKLPQMVDGTLTEITAEDLEGATEIRNKAFQYAPITNITLPNSVTVIGVQAFSYCNKLINITIPNSVTTIKRSAFDDCTLLSTITLPDSVTSLDTGIFQDCGSLTGVVLPNGITTIPGSMFYNCFELVDIIIPNSVTTIKSYAFYRCHNLNPIIPASVTNIESDALKCGSADTKATITFLGTTPPTITVNTFLAQWLNKIIVPAGCGEAYTNATNWANFADYIEEASV